MVNICYKLFIFIGVKTKHTEVNILSEVFIILAKSDYSLQF